MLIRELLERSLASGGRLLGDAGHALPDGVDLGTVLEPAAPATARPGDVVVTAGTLLEVGGLLPADVAEGVGVVVLVLGGVTGPAAGRLLDAPAEHGLRLVDAIAVSDVGAGTLAVVTVRSDGPLAPRPWLSDVRHDSARSDDEAIAYAVGAHVLERATAPDVHGGARAELERARRDLAVVHAVTQGGGGAQGLVAQNAALARKLDEMRRSRTWRAGRVVNALAHPRRSASKVYRRLRRG
jgi:hypothetical protein